MPADPLLTAFAEHTRATEADVARLRAQLRAPVRRAPRRVWAVAGPGVALAAASLLALLLHDPEPAALTASFDTTSADAPIEVAPGVSLTVAGTGTLAGTEQAPRLAWSAGTVDVSVEPGAGLDVRVETDEALVQVVGTVFQVERGPLGTRVGVTRGTVAVTCADGAAHTLTATLEATCVPTSAAGLLGRAQALRSGGSAAADVLASVDRGLSLSPSPAVHTELSALKVGILAQEGQSTAAIEAARIHLATPEAGRRAEVARVGAALGYGAAGCAGAEPFLADLPPEEVAASALGVCQGGGGAPDPG